MSNHFKLPYLTLNLIYYMEENLRNNSGGWRLEGSVVLFLAHRG